VDSYILTEYVTRSKSHLKSLINIYTGDLNTIGKDYYAFSVTKQREFKKQPNVAKLVKNNIYNYFNNVVKGKSADNMWTCLKEAKSQLAGNGYTKGFVPNSCRATNAYAHKIKYAYIYNKFLDCYQDQFFKTHNTEINQDMYALSELVQWLFRSAIRNGQPINLYIPSSRMRELLIKWLDDEI
jgi:hypothetical protein